MDAYWVPAVNNQGTFGRWAFAEFTDVYGIEPEFAARVESHFNEMIGVATRPGSTSSGR
jgi:type III restriction enzyme